MTLYQTFAEWLSEIPDDYLGLNSADVLKIRNYVTANEFCNYLTQWRRFKSALNPCRGYSSTREWRRFLFTAQFLWDEYNASIKKQRRPIKETRLTEFG
jgi:hypothetical protein